VTRVLVFGGWFGSGNIGDDAILIGLRNLLSEAIPGVEIAALSTDVDHTKRVCGVEAFQLRSPRELLAPHRMSDYHRVFSWADVCVLSGGTPIYDYDHISRIVHCGLPGLLGRNLVCFGIGTKPVHSRAGKNIVRHLLGRAIAVSVRDRMSKTELIAIGVNEEIRVTGDSSLFITPRIPDEDTLRELGLVCEGSHVAICPRALSEDHEGHYHAPLSIDVITRIRRSLAEVADHLSNLGYRVVFIPMHDAPFDDDTAEIAIIRGMMRNPSLAVNTIISPEMLRGLLSWMDLVVGLRLHSLILSASMGVPVVGLNYDPKIVGFMEYAGMENYVSDATETGKMLVRRIDEGLNSSETLKRRLLDSCENMRKRVMDEARYIAELL
jgi:polysaccharide pyruvyl transferase WcaK-like protein